MSHLFTVVSAEQQEIVAGGGVKLKDLQVNVISGRNNTGVTDGAVIVPNSFNSYTASFNRLRIVPKNGYEES